MKLAIACVAFDITNVIFHYIPNNGWEEKPHISFVYIITTTYKCICTEGSSKKNLVFSTIIFLIYSTNSEKRINVEFVA